MVSVTLDDATIGILTVLPEEFAAACKLLGCLTLKDSEGRNYRLGNLKRYDQRESHVIVVCCASDMGTSTAAARTSMLLKDCKNVHLVIMCGIAGAVPNPQKASDHVRLGDIVIPSRRGVVQYDFVKESEDGTQERERWNRPARLLIDAAQQLALQEQLGEQKWLRYLDDGITALEKKTKSHTWRRPTIDHDKLREFYGRPKDYITRFVRRIGIPGKLSQYLAIPHPVDEQRIKDKPRVFQGVIASANNLQKNPSHRDFLRDEYGAMAVEMEGAGVGDAVYEADAEYFVVRGTCDYCNGDKNDDWHKYAAVAAAAYTKALLEMVPLQPILALDSHRPLVPVGQMETVRAQTAPRSPISNAVLEVDATVSPLEETAVQTELNQTLDEMFHTQVANSIQNIELSLDSLEFKRAFDEAGKLENFICNLANKLSPELAQRAFELLARISIIKSKVNGNMAEGLKKAEEFIARAKNVDTK